MSNLPKQSLVGSGRPEAMRPRFSYEDAPWFDQPDALEVLGDRTYKLGSGITSEYGRYVKYPGGAP